MLVIKISIGLTEQYDSISTVLQNRDLLPDFNEVRPRLTLEEDKKKRQTAHAAQQSTTALTASVSSPSQISSQTPNYYSASDRGRRRSRGRGRGGGRNYNNRNYNNRGPQSNTLTHPYIVFPSNWTANQWASFLNGSSAPGQAPSAHNSPPYPYPSKPNTTNQNSQGILGPRPDQNTSNTYTPTDIEQAVYTMALNQPDHGFMDTGATSHSANEQGIYSPSNFNKCTDKNIIVGNGMEIPVLAQGNQTLPQPFPPLKLNNVLFAPQHH
ncbi:uncharacterized protein LOC110875167 [Helianthus annuus]|uniref:uncharacterized protein LOC110875167 n=1 Tax=Helianthus annuus TaxID=4232 RepID=UPI000B90321B|nr:uncharacterized protein LOC110875167 [Helianthus annuus]